MKINKNVYTQELDKAYTILKQQYIIIRCLLELVDSNNINEDEKAQLAQSIEDINLKIVHLQTDLNNLGNSVLIIRNTVNTLATYYNSIKDYIAQNGNTTEIGGNLEVDGNGQVNGNLNINGNLTIDGEPLSLGSINVVREDTLGGFLNTVFNYKSKEDIPNKLQTQANVQNLKQINRDTTAIIARYDSLDYVLQIDALVGDSSTRGFIHGYIYNPNIKDIILVTINTSTGVATFTFNNDSSGTSGGVIKGEKTYSIGTFDSESGGYPCTLISGEDIDLSTYDMVTLELWWEESIFPNKTVAFLISDLFGYVVLRFQELTAIVGFVDVINLLSFSVSIDSEPTEAMGLDTSKNMKITGYKF